MTTVSTFLVKIISIPDEELFSETYAGCYIYGRRSVAVARYRMICLVLIMSNNRDSIRNDHDLPRELSAYDFVYDQYNWLSLVIAHS